MCCFLFFFFSVVTIDCAFNLISFGSSQLCWGERLLHLPRTHVVDIPEVLNLENECLSKQL